MADYISKVTLPSTSVTGITYYLKDEEARQMIAGGITFVIAWDGTSTPVVSDIPAGVTVKYNNVTYTGTLAVTDSTPGAFYLVKSSTTPSSDVLDTYDEYTVIKPSSDDTSTWFWEKIGDTKINLSDVVTDVSASGTDMVLGTGSTFTVTQPTVALATDATAGTGKVQVVTGITSASASGDSVTALTGLGTPSTDTFLKGVKVTAQPKVSLTANTTTDTGRITYVQAQGAATTTKLSNSITPDSVTAITGLGTPSTQNAVKSVSPTTSKLVTTSVTGVSGSTTASKATVGTASTQTTATGQGTASNSNSDWLKGISVTNETLIFNAATLNTQTTSIPNITFADVTVPKASTATTVATGAVASTGTGSDIVTGVSVGDTFAAVTGYASPITDTVLGTATTIELASGDTGDVTVATGIGAATTRYLSASASGTTVGADGTASAVTGYANPTTDTVLGTESAITVTPTTTNIKATASGTAVSASGDNVEVITGINVTKGN